MEGRHNMRDGGKEAGLDLTSYDDFFSDPTIKSYYKAFVKVKILVC